MRCFLARRTSDRVLTYMGFVEQARGGYVEAVEYDFLDADFLPERYEIHEERIFHWFHDFADPREVVEIARQLGYPLEGWNDPETLATSAAADPDGCNTGLYSRVPDGRSDRPATDEVTHAVS